MTNPAKDKKLIYYGFVSNLVVRFLSPFLSMAMVFLIIKSLSVESYGKYNVYLSLISIITVLQPALTPIVKRYFPEYIHKKKIFMAIKLLLILFILRIFVVLIVLAGGYISDKMNIFELTQFKFDYFHLVILGSLLVASKHFVLVALNSAFLDHRFFNSVTLIVDSSKILLVLLLKYVGHLNVYNVLLVLIIAEIIAFLSISIRLYKVGSFDLKKIFRSFTVSLEYKRYYDFGKYIFYNIGGGRLLAVSISNLFISYRINNFSVGMYTFASKIPFLAYSFTPTSLLTNAIVPVLTKRYVLGNGNIESFKEALDVYIKINVVCWSLTVLFFSPNINFIISKFFSEKYIAAIPMINFWFLVLFSDLIRVIFTRIAVITENTKIMLFLLLGTILNVVGNIVLVPIYGMYGALYASGFSMIISSMLLVYYANKKVKLSIDKLFLSKLLINISISYFIIYNLSKVVESSWLKFIGFNSLAVILVFALFRLNRCFIDKEREFINSFLPRQLFVF